MAVEENKSHDVAEIKRLIDNWVEALRARDIDGVMSIYARELVGFDITPPLQIVGAGEYRKDWEGAFSMIQGPIDYEIHDLDITTGGDIAFGHSLNRLSGTLNNGQKTGPWVRWTACFRKINGKWLIVHTHASLPVDFENGKAVLNLKP